MNKGTTIYINSEALNALKKIEPEIGPLKATANSDKILLLCHFYNEYIENKGK